MIKYIIEARKYFDRVNGNTYHAVRITDTKTKTTIAKSTPLVYGYGDAYRQTAYNLLLKAGLVKEDDRHNHDLNRERFYYTVSDNHPQRELKELVL